MDKAKLESLISSDPNYQTLLHECMTTEQQYLRILHSLPTRDREIIERYISLCEELDHRSLSLALTL